MIKKSKLLTIIVLIMSFAMLTTSCKEESKHSSASIDAEKSFKRASAYYRLGKVDSAIGEYEKTVLYDKTHKAAHYNLAVLYREKGRNTEALHEFEEYLKYSNHESDAVVRKYVLEEIDKLK